MIKKLLKINLLLISFLIMTISSCSEKTPPPLPPAEINIINENSVPIYAKTPVETTEQAKNFSLELPLRCSVNWKSQNLITNIPNAKTPKLTRTNPGDPLPLIMVKPISFTDLTLDDILKLLLGGINIYLDTPEPPYSKITTNDVEGKLEKVIDLITSYGNVYYHYNKKTQTLTLKRNVEWTLHVPENKELVLSILDALRGLGITNITTNWQENEILFSGNHITEQKVRNLIQTYKEEDTLIAYDVNIYRIYPTKTKGIDWMGILKSFPKDTVKVSINGIIGRTLVTSGKLNTDTLEKFIRNRGKYVVISEGTYILPNSWQGRFDIGQCTKEPRLETDLQILSESQTKSNNRITSDIVLRTSEGEIASYKTPYKIGNNMLIIGIPTHYFLETKETIIKPNAELAIFISPRIINTAK
jgi:hypothetical protein